MTSRTRGVPVRDSLNGATIVGAPGIFKKSKKLVLALVAESSSMPEFEICRFPEDPGATFTSTSKPPELGQLRVSGEMPAAEI